MILFSSDACMAACKYWREWFSAARVKNAVRMRIFPASGANLPLKLYAITKQNYIPVAEIQKSKFHTQKISLEFHKHKVY